MIFQFSHVRASSSKKSSLSPSACGAIVYYLLKSVSMSRPTISVDIVKWVKKAHKLSASSRGNDILCSAWKVRRRVLEKNLQLLMLNSTVHTMQCLLFYNFTTGQRRLQRYDRRWSSSAKCECERRGVEQDNTRVSGKQCGSENEAYLLKFFAVVCKLKRAPFTRRRSLHHSSEFISFAFIFLLAQKKVK